MKSPKPVVIDSSVAVKWLSGQDENDILQADAILKDAQKNKIYIVMPELAKYEIGNALLYKEMLPQQALGSIATYYSIPIQFVDQDQQQAQLTMQIALDRKITFYDASFIALAQELGADLITSNPKHQQKKVNGVNIISLKDY
jgi:predicted nucleic acid-binding protein